jgi:ATPase subunit of ABC transporter with duplicated ATPase domains
LETDLKAKKAMKSNLRAHIESLTFSNDLQIPLRSDSTLVFVGPNNSGKTTALTEIYKRLSGHQTGVDTSVIIKTHSVVVGNTFQEAKNIIEGLLDSTGMIVASGISFGMQNIEGWWKGGQSSLSGLSGFIISILRQEQD